MSGDACFKGSNTGKNEMATQYIDSSMALILILIFIREQYASGCSLSQVGHPGSILRNTLSLSLRSGVADFRTSMNSAMSQMASPESTICTS
jgi:hypothetical protein